MIIKNRRRHWIPAREFHAFAGLETNSAATSDPKVFLFRHMILSGLTLWGCPHTQNWTSISCSTLIISLQIILLGLFFSFALLFNRTGCREDAIGWNLTNILKLFSWGNHGIICANHTLHDMVLKIVIVLTAYARPFGKCKVTLRRLYTTPISVVKMNNRYTQAKIWFCLVSYSITYLLNATYCERFRVSYIPGFLP